MLPRSPVFIEFLLAHRSLSLALMALTAAACVGVGYALLRGRRQGILWALVGLSFVPILALTLIPSGFDARDEILCRVQWIAPTLGRIELVANIALFFPLAFFATLATRHPLIVLAAGVGLSAALEGLQAVATVIGRACDTNDWLMNTIGTSVGVLLACLTIALAARATADPAGDPTSR